MFRTRASLAPLLEVLAAAGAPLNEPDPTVSEADALLDAYERFPLTERGLAASTTSACVPRACRFLDWHGHGADLRAVDTAVVTSAVLGGPTECRRAGAVLRSRAAILPALLPPGGVIATDLSAASLPVTGRRHSTLPRGISAVQARSLLKACDRRTTAGRRDYAVILLPMRLGLRAHEVAALRLEDIDWRAGAITIHGKAGRAGPAAAGRPRSARRSPPTCATPARPRWVAGGVRAQHRTPGRTESARRSDACAGRASALG